MKIFLRKENAIENELKEKIASHQKYTTYNNISENRFCLLHTLLLTATHRKEITSINNKEDDSNSEEATHIFKNLYNSTT